MSTTQVNIKWGKELFKDVEINFDEPPVVFKAQLFALSGVQPERQKIMVKGQTINDVDWTNVRAHLKQGVTLMMMGSSTQLPQAPVKQAQFMEDLTEEQLAMALDRPVGLTNLGNTCYLNAVVQCLKTVPELSTALARYNHQSNSRGDLTGSLVHALRDTYNFMDQSKQTEYQPLLLVQLVRTVFPQFASIGEHGHPQQQDANECFVELMRVLQQNLPVVKNQSVIDQYMVGQFEWVMKCDESPEEPTTSNHESFLQLSCFISQDVKYLSTGLKLKLEEKLEKRSELLNRNASYTKVSRISRLPAYTSIQLVRFCYKEKEKVSAKILKDIKFPIMLDVFDLCTAELQKKLAPVREAFRLQDEEESLKSKAAKKAEAEGQAAAIKDATKLTEADLAPFSFEDDLGSNNSGFYELSAVLTHKGRSVNSGHYVGWTKNTKTGEWYMHDDDYVSRVTEEEILKLSGGGDWHTAYLLFYSPRRLQSRFLNASKAISQVDSNVSTTTTTATVDGTANTN